MSRIGKMPVSIPKGIDVKMDGEGVLTVKGPKGTLSKSFHRDMKLNLEDGIITVERPSDGKMHRSLHGLTRTLVNNMVEGVSKGFEKSLDINGVGYRAQKQGKKLILTLGYSHNIEIPETNDITFDVPNPNRITVKGCDKQAVGELAAKIRRTRPPEAYKGKGVKYENEVVRHKEGKAGAKAKK